MGRLLGLGWRAIRTGFAATVAAGTLSIAGAAHAQSLEAIQESKGSVATDDQAEKGGEEPGEAPERRNAFGFGAGYKFHALRERESETDEPVPDSEHLAGFVIAYDRVLIPNHLALTIAKPFLFGPDRFDSPLDVILKALFRKGSWEPFIGLGISSNIRVFAREREEAEGKRVQYSAGTLVDVGVTHFFTPKWALQFEVAYIWVFTSDVFEHELATVLDGAFYF